MKNGRRERTFLLTSRLFEAYELRSVTVVDIEDESGTSKMFEPYALSRGAGETWPPPVSTWALKTVPLSSRGQHGVNQLEGGIVITEAPLYPERSEAVITWVEKQFPEIKHRN